MARLLLAYDGSEPADAAIRQAAALMPRSDVVVMVAFDRPPSLARARGTVPGDLIDRRTEEAHAAAVEEARQVADAGVALARGLGLIAEADVVESWSGTAAALSDAADRHGCDVLVCGTRGRGGMARALLGSTSTSLLHQANVPVLVAPGTPDDPSGPVVVAYDGSDHARESVAVVGRLFRGRETRIAYAWTSPWDSTLTGRALAELPGLTGEVAGDVEAAVVDAARSVAEDGAELARQHGLAARATLVSAPAAAWRALADLATREQAAVLVAGSQSRGRIAAAFLGSVASSLAANADRPTLIVRRPPAQDGIDDA